MSHELNDKGSKFDIPLEIGQFIGQMTAFARNSKLDVDYTSFIKDEATRGTYSEMSLIPDIFWNKFANSIENETKNIKSTRLENISGFPETALLNELLKSRQLQHIHSGLSLFGFSEILAEKNLTIEDFIKSPERFETPGFVFFDTKDIMKLTVGDTIFFPSHNGVPATIGTVVEKQRDFNKKTSFRSIILYNQDGTGLIKEFNYVTSWDTLIDSQGNIYPKAGILRSEVADQLESVDEMVEPNIIFSKDVPQVIRETPAGFNIDYNQSPEITTLQKQLFNAKDTKERGDIMIKIATQMGLLTQDQIEDDPSQINWPWSAIAMDRCKAFSSEFMRALGLGDSISQWVDIQDKPAFNTGRELSTADFEQWFKKNGLKNGWIPISNLSREKRIQLLADGYVIYGARAGHNWVIIGVVDEKGRTLPVLVQASYNMVQLPVYYTLWPDSDLPAQQQLKWDEPVEDTIWAHKLPGVP